MIAPKILNITENISVTLIINILVLSKEFKVHTRQNNNDPVSKEKSDFLKVIAATVIGYTCINKIQIKPIITTTNNHQKKDNFNFHN